MRLATPLAIVALAAALLAGCGSSSSSPAGSTATGSTGSTSQTQAPSAPAGASAQACALNADGVSGLRVTAVSCGQGQKAAIAWQRDATCRPAAGGSQAGCTVGAYRCIATTAGRGYSVSCARPGHSVAFVAKRG